PTRTPASASVIHRVIRQRMLSPMRDSLCLGVSQAVAHAAESVNERATPGLFKLLAQRVDVHVNDVGKGVLRLFPDVSPQHGPRDGGVLVPKKIFEHFELAERERNLGTIPDNAATEEIHLEAGAPEHRF